MGIALLQHEALHFFGANQCKKNNKKIKRAKSHISVDKRGEKSGGTGGEQQRMPVVDV